MPTLRNNGRLYRTPRGGAENWPTGEEREVSDEIAARLLPTGRFSAIAPPVVVAPAVVPVTKAAAKPKKRRRKKA